MLHTHFSASPQGLSTKAFKATNDKAVESGLVLCRLLFDTIERFPKISTVRRTWKTVTEASRSGEVNNSALFEGKVLEALNQYIPHAANVGLKTNTNKLVSAETQKERTNYF